LEVAWEQLEHFYDMCQAYAVDPLDSTYSKRLPIRHYQGYKWISRRNFEALVQARRHRILRSSKFMLTHRARPHDVEFTWRDIIGICLNRHCRDRRDTVYGAIGLVMPSVAVSADYKIQPRSLRRQILIAELRNSTPTALYDGQEFCCPVRAYETFADNLSKAINAKIDRTETGTIIKRELAKLGVDTESCNHGGWSSGGMFT
jgi:hypothetical protein